MDYEKTPPWLDGNRVDEVEFCRQLLGKRKLMYVDGSFFTEDGRIPNEDVLRKEIYDMLSEFVFTGIPRKVENILAVLRLEAQKTTLPRSQTLIHLANGTYSLDQGFLEDVQMCCRYRLPVRYDLSKGNPDLWNAFLEELLEPEDILTLQEYMGYCLIPTTVAQKMLIIVGRGGEGKSRIGVVMKELLGESMVMGSIAKIEASPFARADLEHALVMVDDDLKLDALKSTSYIKSLVTAELPMDLERKGIQSYQGRVCARFLAFGNDTLRAERDQSYGFFRRQIILHTKPRRPDRVDDPFLGQKLKAERDQIFLWCLTGLFRLIEQDFRFTVSRQARENLEEAMEEGSPLLRFLTDSGYVQLEQRCCVSSRQLYQAYCRWSEENMIEPMTTRAFCVGLRQLEGVLPIRHSKGILIGDGRRVRGFQGLRLAL